MGEMDDARSVPCGPQGAPAAGDVDDLVRRAAEHSLGLDFLRRGSLDAVSATFNVHAFVVDAARDVLAAGPTGVAAVGQTGPRAGG